MSKVALITGATRGIGKEIALTLAKEGYDISLNYRKENEDLDSTKKQIEELGRKCLAVKADVSSFDECENIKEVFVFGNGSYEVEKEGDLMLFETSPDYVLYTFSDTPLPERWTAPASTVKLSLGGLSDKMPYTGKFPDLYIEGNTSSYK